MSMGEEKQKRAAIRPVKESVEDELLARPGVTGVDIAEKYSGGKPTGELGIIVYVHEKKKKDDLGAKEVIPKTVNGVKTDVQELVIELQVAKQLLEADLQLDPAAYADLHGGISMGPSRRVYMTPPDAPAPGYYTFVGTLGAMVRDRSTGTTMALTNFHVACINDGWSVGDRMGQPGRPDAGSTPPVEFGSLTRAQLTENTDGAVITVDTDQTWDYTVQGIGDVAGTATASVGMAVQKRGRTTEHTFGDVGSTDATLSVDYEDGLGLRTLRHQIRIDPDTSRSPRFSNNGDSGSVVMDMNRNVVGLLFAGARDGSATFANPIGVALDELNVDLLVRPVAPLSRPILTCYDTRLSICDISTRASICDIRTRPSVCSFVSRSIVCNVRSRATLCDVVSRPGFCELTRGVCGAVSRGLCPGDGGFDPRPPVGGASPYDAASFEENPAFLAGYLAALEEVSDLDQGEGI